MTTTADWLKYNVKTLDDARDLLVDAALTWHEKKCRVIDLRGPAFREAQRAEWYLTEVAARYLELDRLDDLRAMEALK